MSCPIRLDLIYVYIYIYTRAEIKSDDAYKFKRINRNLSAC